MKFQAICHTCRRQHCIDFDPVSGPGAAFSDWLTKHPGPTHETDFEWAERSGKMIEPESGWQHYLHNADVKVAYAASSAPTITLASLAASSTWLAGRESTSVSNASNKYLDYLVAGHFRAAATNTQVGIIRVGVVGARNDTPNWPDVFDGTDSAETVTGAGMYNAVVRIAAEMAATSTASATWPFGPVAIASLFGGVMPTAFVFFISHNIHTSTNAWNATEGDHTIQMTPAYATVA